MVAGPGGVWVANSGDDTVERIDPDTEQPDPPIDVGDGPDALALDGSTLWVANGRAGTLTEIDTRTRQRAASDIPVNAGPASIAVTPNDVWVANEFDQSVSRVPRSSGHVQRIEVADGPSSLVVHDGQVWVANRYGASVSQIDTDTNAVHENTLGSGPAAIAVVDGDVWAAAGAYANGEHRGGAAGMDRPWLRHRPPGPGVRDHSDVRQPRGGLAYDGLVAQRLTGGRRSLAVVADLATMVPEPADGGRTYVFSIRPGVHYSTGELVQPSDFLRGFERVLRSDTGGGEGFEQIVGAGSCMGARACSLQPHAGQCRTTPRGRLTIHLTEPDAEFLDKLTNLVYPRPPEYAEPTHVGAPLPEHGSVPDRDVDHGAVTLTRNPYFHQWSASAQPEGYPDVIVYRPYVDEQAGIADVLDGRAQGTYVHGALPPSVTSHPDIVRSTRTTSCRCSTSSPTRRTRRSTTSGYARPSATRWTAGGLPRSPTANPACQMVPPSFPASAPTAPSSPVQPAGSTRDRTSPRPDSWLTSPGPRERRSPCSTPIPVRRGDRPLLRVGARRSRLPAPRSAVFQRMWGTRRTPTSTPCS